MADEITLKLQPRIALGKKVRRLRQGGIIPVHLYGPGITSQPLQCEGRELIKVLTRAGGNTPVSITIEGEGDEHLAFVREIQWNPIKGDLFHVDFLRAEATQLVSVEVPIALSGESPGAREIGGTVVQQLYSLMVEALPLDIPRDIGIDLLTLDQPDSVIRAGDIQLPAGATLVTDPGALIVRIEAARVEEVVEPAPTEEGEEEAPAEEERQPGEGGSS